MAYSPLLFPGAQLEARRGQKLVHDEACVCTQVTEISDSARVSSTSSVDHTKTLDDRKS